MKASDLKPGNAVVLDGRLYVVVKTEFTKPGKGPAYVQAKLKDMAAGGQIERRFNSTESVTDATVDRRQMEFLFAGADGATFMDLETYDQMALGEDLLGDSLLYLTPNTEITVLCHEGRAISVELPAAVEMEITETIPVPKGATATNQLKEAVCETGLKIRVPPFIGTGEKVRISTIDGAYLSRVKGQ